MEPDKEFIQVVSIGERKNPIVGVCKDGTIYIDPEVTQRELLALMLLALMTRK
jgi:hypothetical protein